MNVSVDDSGSVSFSWPSLMLWFLNIFIFGFCLVKMFVYGDPIIPSKSKEAQKFWTYRRQADYLLSKVRYSISFCLYCFSNCMRLIRAIKSALNKNC